MANATIGPTTKRGQRIIIHTTYAEKDVVRQIPGVKWDQDALAWTLPIAWAPFVQMQGVFGANLRPSQELADWAWEEYNTRIKPALDARDALEAAGDHTTWRPYQLADVNFMLIAGDCTIGNEPGTGKTVSTLTAARALHYARGSALPMIIICPNTVKHHWEKHFERWFPEAVPYLLPSGAAKKRKILEEAATDPNAAVIINIEAVRLHSRVGAYGSIRLARCQECFRAQDWVDLDQEIIAVPVPPSRCDVHSKELNEIPFQTAVIDEAHRIKDPAAKQTRACWQVLHGRDIQQRWALTGTPLANHVGDLWSVMHGVSPIEYTAKSEFVDRYAQFTYNVHGTMDISDVRPDTREELFRFLDPRFRRMLKAVVLPQLPPKVWTTYEVELTPKQRKMYDEIETQLFARDDHGNMLIATNNLVKNMRLIQLASSTCEIEYTGEVDDRGNDLWKVNLVNPSSKIDALIEAVSDFEGHSVCVSAFSKKLIDLAASRLEEKGISCVKITGGINEWDRKENLRRFQEKRVRVILFTLGAGGVGVDMTAGSVMIRLQRSYSMIENVQGLGRFDRIGSEVHDSLYIVDVIAPGTVEDDQLERLRIKEDRLETIVRDRAALARAGLDASQLELEYQSIIDSQV